MVTMLSSATSTPNQKSRIRLRKSLTGNIHSSISSMPVTVAAKCASVDLSFHVGCARLLSSSLVSRALSTPPRQDSKKIKHEMDIAEGAQAYRVFDAREESVIKIMMNVS